LAAVSEAENIGDGNLSASNGWHVSQSSKDNEVYLVSPQKPSTDAPEAPAANSTNTARVVGTTVPIWERLVCIRGECELGGLGTQRR
jgi:hypothetical protein